MKTLEANLDASLSGFRTNMAELMQSIERRNAETADRMATATERMATGWWWQTTVLVAIIAVVATVASGGLAGLIEAWRGG